MTERKRHLKLVQPQYTLCYGMRLDRGAAPELVHPHVPVMLPDGSRDTMALHVINGSVGEIKARLLQSVDAFFEIYGES
ncbi:MAG: allantoinase [Nitrospirae bacterium]|nr:MAG: allantoinase [Nitrospirota bacterium]